MSAGNGFMYSRRASFFVICLVICVFQFLIAFSKKIFQLIDIHSVQISVADLSGNNQIDPLAGALFIPADDLAQLRRLVGTGGGKAIGGKSGCNVAGAV